MSEEAKKPQPIVVKINEREAVVIEGAQNMAQQLQMQAQRAQMLHQHLMMTHVDGKGLVPEKTPIIGIDLDKDNQQLIFYPEGADLPEPPQPEKGKDTKEKRGKIDS